MFFEQVYRPENDAPLMTKEQMRQARIATFGEDAAPVEIPRDMTDRYNTALSDDEERQYQDWAKKEGREQDVIDYDLRGAWKELQSGTMSEDERGHLGDKYKKPNHPTFSDQSIYNNVDGYAGGSWTVKDGRDVYTPGRLLDKQEAYELRKYFAEYEPGVELNLEGRERPEPKQLPTITRNTGVFDGLGDVWKAVPSAIYQSVSSAITAANTLPYEFLSTQPETRSWLEKQHEIMDENARAIRAENKAFYEPDPQTMGTGSQIIYGLTKTLSKAIGYTALAGPAGGALAFGADVGIDEAQRLKDEGVDDNTANWVGINSFAMSAIGLRLPAVLGSSRIMSGAYGAGVNLATSAAEVQGIRWILEHQDYNELAKQYEISTADMVVGGAVGAVFGAGFWRSAEQIRIDRYREAGNKLAAEYRLALLRGGKFTDEQATAQANINARMVEAFAYKANLNVEDVAARVMWSDDGKSAVYQAADRAEYDQIIGSKGASRLGEDSKLAKAAEMEAAGKTVDEIHEATGWDRGRDGKWRFEIPDMKMKSEVNWSDDVQGGKSANAKHAQLGDIVDAEKLFRAYPELKGVRVIVDDLGDTVGGQYSPTGDVILLNQRYFADGADQSKALSVLQHEVQHAVQEIEGFTRGASPERMPSKGRLVYLDMEKLRRLADNSVWEEFDRLDKEFWRLFNDEGVSVDDPRVVELDARIEELMKRPEVASVLDEKKRLKQKWNRDTRVVDAIDNLDIDAEPYDEAFNLITEADPFFAENRYRQVAGEVEARNVQARARMSEAERRARSLLSTEDVAREDQVNSYGQAFYQQVNERQYPFGQGPQERLDLLKRSRRLDRQIHKWRQGDQSEVFDLGEPSWVLQLFGASKQENVKIFGNDFLHAILKPGETLRRQKGKHGLSDDDVRGILVGIQRPLAVFKSTNIGAKAGEESLVLLTELTSNGKNIVAPIWLTTNVNGEIVVDNRIPTAYRKSNIKQWVDNGLLLGYEKEKGFSLLLESMGSNRQQLGTSNRGEPLIDRAIVYENDVSVQDIYQKDSAVRGAYIPASNTIRLTPNANISTFSHEHSHWYLNALVNVADTDGVNASLTEDFQTLLKTWGIGSVEQWRALGVEGQRRYHEQFASWTEQYLSEGKSPVPGLEGLFARMGEWIMDLYRGVLGRESGNAAAEAVGERYKAEFGEDLPPISPEVRKVLDRMYGAQQKASRFRSTRVQSRAARLVQSQRVNNEKITAPLANNQSPDMYRAAQAAQESAAQALNEGRPVDVSQHVNDSNVNGQVIENAQNSFGRAFNVGNNDTLVVLQNRDRTGVVAIGQMNAIASNPIYGLMSFDRTTNSGAPIVSFGSQLPDPQYQGRSDIIIDGSEKVPVTYFVVEADDVLMSNRFDGSPNAAYGNDASRIHAIAGNGRMAGISEAYRRGTADQYKQDLMADSATHGVNPDVIAGMKKPVLVRYMTPEKVTTGFIERSNNANILQKSAVEMAAQDAPRIRRNMSIYRFDEDGNPTAETLDRFLIDIGEPNALGVLVNSDGTPTESALNRIRAAVFYEAYQNKELTQLVAADTDKQGIKRILTAMASFAPHVISIRQASDGTIDLGPVMVDVVNRIRNGKLENQGDDFNAQNDWISNSPLLIQLTEFMDQNRNSASAMSRVLEPFANDLEGVMTAVEDMFGGGSPKRVPDMAEVMERLRKFQNDEIDRYNEGQTDPDKIRARLPDIDVEKIRQTMGAVQEAAAPARQVAEAVVETVNPEMAEAVRQQEAEVQAQQQARAQDLLGDNAERVAVEDLAIQDPDAVFRLVEDDGTERTVTARELLESEGEIDRQADVDVAGMGTAVQCIITNRGISE